MELTKLKFEGYHYDETTTSKINSVFFIKDDNEDDWIEIIPMPDTAGIFYTVLTIESCETVKAELYIESSDGQFVKVGLKKS